MKVAFWREDTAGSGGSRHLSDTELDDVPQPGDSVYLGGEAPYVAWKRIWRPLDEPPSAIVTLVTVQEYERQYRLN
jgi:hypothetical protein